MVLKTIEIAQLKKMIINDENIVVNVNMDNSSLFKFNTYKNIKKKKINRLKILFNIYM